MSALKVLTEPDGILRKISKPVSEIDTGLRAFMHAMRDTMIKKEGAGLAAIQVAKPSRIMVIDASYLPPEDSDITGSHDLLYMINPEIVDKSQAQIPMKEGCLSLPGQGIEISRAQELTVNFLDFDGKPRQLKARDMLARIIQHEMDHLNGVLMIDYLSKFRKMIAINKLKKLKKL